MSKTPLLSAAGWLFACAGLIAPARAGAATFVVTVTNTSAFPWAQGLLTLAPVIDTGAVPQPGQNEYFTYGYAHSQCNLTDGFCGAGCTDTGNATLLAQRWGLTIGTNAWVVPAVAAFSSAPAISVRAGPGSRLYYISYMTGQIDDFIAAHTAGDPHNFGIDLFDANGLPLPTVALNYSAYDIASDNGTNGNGNSCASLCPPPASGCFVAPGNSSVPGGTLNTPAAPPTLSATWTRSFGNLRPDGLALGDVRPAGNEELVVVANGGDYFSSPVTLAPGEARIYLRSGTLTNTFFTNNGHDLLGFPLLEELNGLGQNEFVIGESSPLVPLAPDTLPGSAYAQAFVGAGFTSYWTSAPYAYSGFWNMGASAGDVRSDQHQNEVVIPDLEGNIAVLRRNGSALNNYSVFTGQGETLYGHATIADVDNIPGNEIIVFGARRGRVMVFGATTTGSMTLKWMSDVLPNRGFAFGNGPAVADIDGDAAKEIVIVSANTHSVYAFDATRSGGACEYRWLGVGGAYYYWTSPVIGDVDGDGTREVVTFSSDSVMSVLSAGAPAAGCSDGQIEWEYVVGNGGGAWFTPALANLTGTSALDVVVANYQTLEVVDVSLRRPAYRASEVAAQFYPSAVIEPGVGTAGQPGGFIYASGWNDHAVHKYGTPAGAPIPVPWPTFMGNNARTGAR